MPGLFGNKPSRSGDSPALQGPDADLRATDALLRPANGLTQELLDWVVQALTAVLSTDAVRGPNVERRVEASLRDALKQVDRLWPHTTEFGGRHAREVRTREGMVLGLEGAVQVAQEGRGGSSSGLRERVQGLDAQPEAE